MALAVPRGGNRPSGIVDAVFPTSEGAKWVYCRIALGTSPPEVGLGDIPALAGSGYQNSLGDADSMETDFIDFSEERNESGSYPIGGDSFRASSGSGLGLTAQSPYPTRGTKLLQKALPVSKDWSITVRATVSDFATLLTNPIYKTGLSIGKLSGDYQSSFTDHIDLVVTRAFRSGVFSNAIGLESFKGGSLLPDPPKTPAQQHSGMCFLRLLFSAKNFSLEASWSGDNVEFFSIGSLSLADEWSLAEGDQLLVAVFALSAPFQAREEFFENQGVDYNLPEGRIWLSDLSISGNSTTQLFFFPPHFVTAGTSITLSAVATPSSVVTYSIISGDTGKVTLNGNQLAINSGNGSITIRATVADTPERTGATAEATITLQNADDAFESLFHGQEPNSDKDNDGIPALAEFALGGSSIGNDASVLPQLTRQGNTFKLTAVIRTAGATVTAQSTASLFEAWSPGIEGTDDPDQSGVAPGFKRRNFAFDATAMSRAFMRLHVQKSP
jgi:hypothetical protein